MAGDEASIDDDYVANILKQDAKNTAKQYKLVGMDAFQPKKSRSGAPKPNTNFLRHIIRQTDNHNAALLAKEAQESRARLKGMNRGIGSNTNKREAGRLTPPDQTDEETLYKRRKRGHAEDSHEERDRRRRRATYDSDTHESRSRRSKYKDKEHRRDKESHYSSEEDRKYKSRHSKRDHRSERRRDYDSDEDNNRSRRKDDYRRRHVRRHSSSRSRSRSRSPSRSRYSQKHHKSSKRQRRSRSRNRSREMEQHRRSSKRAHEERHSHRSTASPGSDSDPLADIVGPLPPTEPIVRTRGRGAHKAQSMGMDARFSSTYDPSVDVRLNSDVEDDWGDALEALRDRQRLKQQHADRLKAAGFSEEEVKKWEKGDEKTEDDVRWSKKGEGREWDRGKVLDDDGDVDLKADWGRLK